MTGRIFRGVALTAALAVLLTAALTAAALFGVYEDGIAAELRTEAEYILRALSRESDELGYFADFEPRGRVTLIAPDGGILYESDADSAGMDNHLGRPEVEQALRSGWGESERRSDTLSEVTIYCAARTRAGNVLRLSSTRSSMLGVFLRALPLLAGILLAVALVSMLVARMAARRIVAPLNNLNLDSPRENHVYDELSPLLMRMDRQRQEIELRMRQLDDARRELSAITRNMREGLVVLDREGNVLSMNESAARIFAEEAGTWAGESSLKFCRDSCLRRGVTQHQVDRSAARIFGAEAEVRVGEDSHECARGFGKQAQTGEGADAILEGNDSAARIFGADVEARVGENPLEFSRNPELRECVARARAGESADAILERDGSAYQVLASPVMKGGEAAGVVLLILDVTEKIEAERSRREFTANVSHELKTPLTSISGYAELIREGVARPEDVRGFAGRICDEAKRLMALIEDILALSRLDERRGIGEREETDLCAAAREATDRLAPLAEEKGIALCFAGEAARIEAYPRPLAEMLTNRIDSAIKYMPAGGRVEVSVRNCPGGATFAVEDNGVGIPEEHHGRCSSDSFVWTRATPALPAA